jgi:hypothetical protein
MRLVLEILLAIDLYSYFQCMEFTPEVSDTNGYIPTKIQVVM